MICPSSTSQEKVPFSLTSGHIFNFVNVFENLVAAGLEVLASTRHVISQVPELIITYPRI